jgi:hypothetical protein
MAENDGSTTTGNESNNDQGTNASDASGSTTTAGAGSANGTTTGNATLTQAQVDAIVRDRIAREREKFKGFDDLKKKAEQYDASWLLARPIWRRHKPKHKRQASERVPLRAE